MNNSDHPESDSRRFSQRVVDAVAQATETDPLDLPPIYHTIDPDALDTVVGDLVDGSVQFQYAGQQVTIDGGGGIRVTTELAQGPGQLDVVNDD